MIKKMETILVILAIAYVLGQIAVGVARVYEHKQLLELKKENLRLEIQKLKLELGK